MTLRVFLSAAALTAAAAVSVNAALPGSGVVSSTNMEWVWNNPQVVGSDIEFYEERRGDDSLRRYAIAGAMGHGFQIIDITDPALPLLAGVFADPGVSWQGDPQVNPRRKIVSFATDGLPAATLGHDGVADGIALVDISDVANPRLLSTLGGLGGSHNSTIVDDRYLYTALPTHIVDYSDPENPVDLGIPEMTDPADPDGPKKTICGHDITLDPNRPDRVYSACSGSSKIQIIDVSDPANPVLISEVVDPDVSIAHQVDPAPDSSFLVLTDERGGGLSNTNAPGGGAHVWDISGKHTGGEASETNPIKIGIWFAPFNGLALDDDQAGPWGNVTIHNFTFQAERFLMSTGWYSMGSWVADMQYPTDGSGPFREWEGDQFGNGPTTWGNTQGHILLEGDEVWSAKWTRFDDPRFDRYVFTNGLTRGMDTLFYTGGLPKKVSRLAVDAEAAFDPATGTAVISGKLDRYAVWTHRGWENRPLAGRTIRLLVDGVVAGDAVTGVAGTWFFDMALAPGEHEVVATWAGDARYRPESVTQTVVTVEFEPPPPARQEAIVNDRVRLIAGNASFGGGTAAFDLRIENTSEAPVFAPLRAEITALTSASGTVAAINADNGAGGAGAFWGYDAQIGGDDELSPAETSGARRLRFSNNGESFTVVLDVIGHIEGEVAATGAAGDAEEGGDGPSAPDLARTLLELTVNPLTGSVRINTIPGL